MRISNLVASVEDGLVSIGQRLSRATSDAKLTLKAARINDALSAVEQAKPDDQVAILMRAAELRAIDEAAAVRKAEVKARRQLARAVLKGQYRIVPTTPKPEATPCSPQPSSPSSDSGS